MLQRREMSIQRSLGGLCFPITSSTGDIGLYIHRAPPGLFTGARVASTFLAIRQFRVKIVLA
jgi:hypothetical protein